MKSQVLMQLKAEKLPPPEIACRACQFATWMEFRAGPKCYCAITQAWMYEPNQQPNQMVLACDKQLEEDEMEVSTSTPHKAVSQAPEPTSSPPDLVPASLGLDLDALAAMPVKKAGPGTFF